MAASYPSAAKAFTTKTDSPTSTIFASHVNDLQDEIVAIEQALLTTGVAHNLFPSTDAARDLGTGSLRWRDLFVGRNATFSGASAVLTFSGATAQEILFSAADGLISSNTNVVVRIDKNNNGTNSFLVNDGGNTTIFDVTEGGKVAIASGGFSNANMTTGLTINQGAADDEIIALKSSDIAHGMTSITETDTYALFKKRTATTGGLSVRGFDAGANPAVSFIGIQTTAVTTKSILSEAAIEFRGALKNLTTEGPLGADANIVVFRNDSTTRFILDADGDSHQDVGTAWTNFDDGDDIARLDAVAVALAREGDPLREAFVHHFEEKRQVIESMPGKRLVSFNEDGHHFLNMSRLAMLHNGAIRQLARQQAMLRQALAAHGLLGA